MSYQKLKNEIDEIALNCGRKLEEITLVAVSKYADIDDMRAVYDQGCRDFGESRLQEATAKIQALPSDINWHFIGRLQTNKAAKVIENFNLIHSVASVELASIISKKNVERGSPSSILLQINTTGEPSKQGFAPEEFRRDFDGLSALPGIVIEGLMTMAPLEAKEEAVREAFSLLRKMRNEFKLNALSMGMSQDYKIAIEEGATLLRIGTQIFNK